MLLGAQGLNSAPKRATKDDVRGIIRRMGVLQIDSISVVARSPYLVLWSRLGSYEPRWLDELLAEGALFEYWSHAACFIPIQDYGLYRRLMIEGGEKTRTWMQAHHEEIEHVMERISEKGPVRAAEFARTDGKAGGWWEWKPEKRALEHLFAAGELMITRRENFHRVYDLRERVLAKALPDWEDALAPKEQEVRRALALKAVRALGVASARWVPDYFRTPKKGVARLLEELADEGELVHAGIEGLDEPAYIHPDNAGPAEKILSGGLRSSVTTFLSRSILWSGIGRVLSSSSTSSIRSRSTPRLPAAGTGTTPSRYSTMAPSLAGSTPRPTASREPSRSRLYTSSQTRQ